MHTTVSERLKGLSEPAYREFCQRLTVDGMPLLGVRMGHIRSLAKELAKTGKWSTAYLGDVSTDRYHEEKLVRMLALAYAPMEEENRIPLLGQLLPYVDNWALCDSLCSTLKQARKASSLYREFIVKQLHAQHAYTVRFGIVMLLNHFMHEPWIEQNLSLIGQVKSEHHYIRMAQAWAVATAYTVSPSIVESWLSERPLDATTARMTTQKIRDSFRIQDRDKNRVSTLINSIYQ